MVYDNARIDYYELLQHSKIFVSKYNATTFLETLAMNIPTVIFWNPSHSELRESAIPYFEKLRQVGIFHDNPVSAAEHISNVWESVDKWWGSKILQEVITDFCKIYNNTPANRITDIGKNLM